MNEIDAEIAEVFSLLGVLLVFSFAYLSYLLPEVSRTIELPVPPAKDDRGALSARVRTQRLLLLGLMLVVLMVLALLTPLSWKVLAAIRPGAPFDTTRAALLLVDLFLAATLLFVLGLIRRAGRRASVLEKADVRGS